MKFFLTLLVQCRVKDVPTTSKTYQTNTICDRMHQTVSDVLRTPLCSNSPKTVVNAVDLIGQALSTAIHVMRTNIHT